MTTPDSFHRAYMSDSAPMHRTRALMPTMRASHERALYLDKCTEIRYTDQVTYWGKCRTPWRASALSSGAALSARSPRARPTEGVATNPCETTRRVVGCK